MAPGVLYEFQKRIGCCTSIALFPMLRPELVEMRATVKRLKADADMRLTLDVEAQQSFEFLSDQIHGLRRAFSTLSDVFVEEIPYGQTRTYVKRVLRSYYTYRTFYSPPAEVSSPGRSE